MYMSFEMRRADEKKALRHLKQKLGKDNPCYRDLKVDFIHRMIFLYGSMIVSTLIMVGVCAFITKEYGEIGNFGTFVILFVFLAVNIACCEFEDNLNIGFWKWNRYYRLWLLYKGTAEKKVPLEIIVKYSEHYLEKDAWNIKSYRY